MTRIETLNLGNTMLLAEGGRHIMNGLLAKERALKRDVQALWRLVSLTRLLCS
jgi:hypothetical protein